MGSFLEQLEEEKRKRRERALARIRAMNPTDELVPSTTVPTTPTPAPVQYNADAEVPTWNPSMNENRRYHLSDVPDTSRVVPEIKKKKKVTRPAGSYLDGKERKKQLDEALKTGSAK